ncbi:hypothetical protein HZA40_05260 [Candidatus Peregrinibacteria bacterium]|nr:hypothetical protein [Candidatus Peregrinibacteria bacterium]
MKSKHLAAIIGISFTLIITACGGGSSSSNDTGATIQPGKTTYNTDTFSVQIPKDWETLEKNSFTSNVPPETIVVFRNNIKNDIFTANVNIAQKALSQKITVKDFAKSNLEILKNNLIGYQLLNEKEDKINFGKDSLPTYKTEVEGKKSASERIMHFRQVYVINNNIMYTVTATYLPNEDESVGNALGEILDSFVLK